MPAIDGPVYRWLHDHTTPPLTHFILWIGAVHAAIGLLVMALTVGMFLAWQRDRYGLLALALILPGSMLLNGLMKLTPSEHTAVAATLFYAVLAALLRVTSVPSLAYRRYPHAPFN